MAKKKRKVLTQNQKRDISAPYSDFASCEEMVRVMYDQYQKLVRLGKSENARLPIFRKRCAKRPSTNTGTLDITTTVWILEITHYYMRQS